MLTTGCSFSLQVCVQYWGQESTGLVERHSWAEDKVTVWLLDQKLQICCKAEEVWLAEPPAAVPGATSRAGEPRLQPTGLCPGTLMSQRGLCGRTLALERHVAVEVGVWGCLGLGKECGELQDICLLLKVPVARDTVRVFLLKKKPRRASFPHNFCYCCFGSHSPVLTILPHGL